MCKPYTNMKGEYKMGYIQEREKLQKFLDENAESCMFNEVLTACRNISLNALNTSKTHKVCNLVVNMMVERDTISIHDVLIDLKILLPDVVNIISTEYNLNLTSSGMIDKYVKILNQQLKRIETI